MDYFVLIIQNVNNITYNAMYFSLAYTF